jgi:uncharacterized membrane protein YgcG
MQKATCVVMCWLLASSIGYAQSDWSAVTALPSGTRVRIEAERGRYAQGVLQAVDDMQITLQKKPPATRADIRKVELLGAHQTARFAKRGFIIGAVAGISMSYATAQRSKGAWALFLGGSWGAIGALIGATDGIQSRESVVVFRAP